MIDGKYAIVIDREEARAATKLIRFLMSQAGLKLSDIYEAGHTDGYKVLQDLEHTVHSQDGLDYDD